MCHNPDWEDRDFGPWNTLQVAARAAKYSGSWAGSWPSLACLEYQEFAACAGGYHREAASRRLGAARAAESEELAILSAAGWGRLL